MTAVVEARAVGYSTEDEIVLVQRFDLAVTRGEIVVIVGPNGAGKTTALRLLGAELRPTTGEVLLLGDPTTAMSPQTLSDRRAILPQSTLLQFAFTCLDVVMMGRYRRTPSDDSTVIEKAMGATDTVHLGDRLYPTLSGGEQKRGSLARVLAQEAPLLLLDEPTSSLDLRHQELVMATMRGLAKGGISVVGVVHDLNLAARHADRIVLMDQGAVAAEGTVEEVLRTDVIEGVYGQAVTVLRHPVSGHPIIVPE